MLFRGIPRRSSTCLNHFEPGIAPSRAKAQVLRDAAVTHPTPQIMPRTSNGMRRQKAPAEFPVADLMIVGTGWPEARLASMEMSGRTKQMGIRKPSPARKLRKIPPTMALGTWTAGWRTSSHILICFFVSLDENTVTVLVHGRRGLRSDHSSRRETIRSLEETNAE